MKIKISWLSCLVFMGLMFPLLLSGQSIKRQSIGSYGATGYVQNILIRQTIGQPYSTKAFSDNIVGLTPGFQQPESFKKQTKKVSIEVVSVDVYPNPASERFFIKSPELLENTPLRISDISGRVLLKTEINSLEVYEVNCSGWTSGIYIVQISSDHTNYNYISKIIISN